jgi:hypothetical protein
MSGASKPRRAAMQVNHSPVGLPACKQLSPPACLFHSREHNYSDCVESVHDLVHLRAKQGVLRAPPAACTYRRHGVNALNGLRRHTVVPVTAAGKHSKQAALFKRCPGPGAATYTPHS